TVAGGVGDAGGQHGDGGAGLLVGGDQVAQGGRVQQRHVAVGDQHGPGGGGDLVEAALDGSAGGGDLVLVGDRDLAGALGQVRGDLVPFVAQHDHELVGSGALGGGDRMDQQGSSPDLVQHLRGAGLHAGPGTGGQDDDCGGGGG